MKKIKNVTLAFSCPEKTDSLNKKEKGFHCEKCSTQVIDFTNRSAEELKNAINNAQKPICGIFKQTQLSDQFLKYAAATLIVTSAMTTTTFGQEKIKAEPDMAANDSLANNNEGLISECLGNLQQSR